MLDLKIKKLYEDAILPTYATDGSVGLDLYAHNAIDWFDASKGAEFWFGTRIMFGTGVAVEIPVGYEGQVRSRSSLACKNCIIIPNAPGTIDRDYRGEVLVTLYKLLWENNASYTIKKGDRIAQLIVAPVMRCNIVEADELGDTVRGEGGHGSTGR